MKTKLITALTALTLLIPISVVNAAEPPATIAIVDTAVNASLPIFKDKIIYEVCLLDWPSCPNGTPYQEGPGAAALPKVVMPGEGFEHGNQMASAAVLTNPNVKIIFIRIVGATATGYRQIIDENTFVNALTWVKFNRDRFNIKAVAISQSHHNLLSGTAYCPSTPLTENAIKALVDIDTQVFLPAGNNRDLQRVSWPACIPTAVSISASAYGDGPAIYTNYDSKVTDFFARGDMLVYNPDGTQVNAVGTSVSTQVAGSLYIGLKNKYPTYTYSQIASIMNAKATNVVSRTIKGKILTKAVLNG